MADYRDRFFIAKVVEVIQDTEGKPTFGLRVRVPTVHGNDADGVKDESLPIARPLPFPGAIIDKNSFASAADVGKVVYVIFESGSLSKPRYFGLFSDTDPFSPPSITIDTEDMPYATATTKGVVRVEKIGTTGYIYTSDPE